MNTSYRTACKCALLAAVTVSLLFTTARLGFTQVDSSMHSGRRLYDNFERKHLNPDKWVSQWQCGSPSVMECDRGIVDHKLRLYVRDYGARDTNTNIQYGVSELDLRATAVTDISAGIVVLKTDSQGCTTSPQPATGTKGQALIYGSYFNGGGGTANDDVQAFLDLERRSTDPLGVLEASGFLGYQGTFFGDVDLGPVNVGERVIAELFWDKRNHRFIAHVFHPDTGASYEQTMPYSISDSMDAVFPLRGLSARGFSENCTGVKTFADMEVAFDEVKAN